MIRLPVTSTFLAGLSVALFYGLSGCCCMDGPSRGFGEVLVEVTSEDLFEVTKGPEKVGELYVLDGEESKSLRDHMQTKLQDPEFSRRHQTANFWGHGFRLVLEPIDYPTDDSFDLAFGINREFSVYVYNPGFDGKLDLDNDYFTECLPSHTYLKMIARRFGSILIEVSSDDLSNTNCRPSLWVDSYVLDEMESIRIRDYMQAKLGDPSGSRIYPTKTVWGHMYRVVLKPMDKADVESTYLKTGIRCEFIVRVYDPGPDGELHLENDMYWEYGADDSYLDLVAEMRHE